MDDEKIVILPSEPLKELTDETDLFGLLSKAKLVKNILTSQIINENNINMIALYGCWGSGKTTLMNYLIENLELECNYMLFEAWKLEKDTNLALSLLEQMLETVLKKSKVKQGILETGRTLFTLSKNLLYSTSISAFGFNINTGKAAEMSQKELDGIYEKKSYYSKIEEFKVEFKKLEEDILKQGKKIIIFIDDLDRCEPENVLNLLSAIKLFFTYSNNIVYFCGIDKGAISAAIKTKYNNTIDYEDYLEKIFDLSVNMPEQMDINKVIRKYFPDKNNEFWNEITTFFNSINLLNPRRIIKVLNKYNWLKQYNMHLEDNILKHIVSDGNFFNVIFLLIMIILYEFYHIEYLTVLNYKIKFNAYKDATYVKPNTTGDYRNDTDSYLSKIIESFPKFEINETIFTSRTSTKENEFYYLINFFTPAIQGEGVYRLPKDFISYVRQFDIGSSKVLINFCYYLVNLRERIYHGTQLLRGFKDIKLIDLFNISQQYF